MKDIDFLPSRYRERSQLRRVMLWRIGTLSVIAGLVLAVQVWQMSVKSRVAKQCAEIEPQHVAALVTSSRLQRLQTELAASEQFAELYTYLQHPWPRTQLLAAISQTLPPKLTLTEIQITQSAGDLQPSESAADNPAAKDLPTATRDLQFLRDEDGKGVSVVTISGKTTDISQLQTYVEGFSRSPFFATAKLESLESAKELEGPAVSQFELRLEVKAGYAQPGGPIVSNDASADQTVAMRVESRP